MFWLGIAILGLIFALIPAIVYVGNMRSYLPTPPAESEPTPVSLLIPARNEELSIRQALDAALATQGVEFEVIVLDDHSVDQTAEIVKSFSRQYPFVRLESAPPLPAGWCGKQHACYVLSKFASHSYLVFIDADVRLAPDALARLSTFLRSSGASLASGIPRQETGTILEKLVLPLIHFLLLGFLPIDRMRASRLPAFGAGCGQLFIAERSAYESSGGHSAIKASLHDGVTLPRAFRRAGHLTDLFDATDLATCRMYRTGSQVWNGLAKNAREGLAATVAIIPWTVILGLGQVMPFCLLALWPNAWVGGISLVAWLLGLSVRFHSAIRFRQSWLGAIFHPLGVAILLAIQWYAVARHLVGRPVGWKGRQHPTVSKGEA